MTGNRFPADSPADQVTGQPASDGIVYKAPGHGYERRPRSCWSAPLPPTQPPGSPGGLRRVSNQCQPCLDSSSRIVGESGCLQSTFTLSVTVASLGLNLFLVCPGRPLSGLVVVRDSGQALHDLPLTRWLSLVG